MADTTSIRCTNFGDLVSITLNRGQIAGEVQDRDLNFIKGSLNEHYITIATERDWYWRKFDRDFVFKRAVTTGTVAVTQDSREVVFTGLVVDLTYLGKSIRVVGDLVLYRIIGVDIGANAVFLSAPYTGQTNAAANFKLLTYEFPLPPDCDKITQLYVDYSLPAYANAYAQLDPINVMEFNRLLSCNLDTASVPCYYNRDGNIFAETLPPLDVMVLNYDFLGGEVYDKLDKVRIFPIEPDVSRVIHLNYSIKVDPMMENSDVPLIPIDNRWVLIHFALADWFRVRGQYQIADREFAIATKILNEMRDEYHKTDPKPKFISSLSDRQHATMLNRNTDLFWISRRQEY